MTFGRWREILARLTTSVRWGRVAALGLGVLLGILAGTWLEIGTIWEAEPTCRVWVKVAPATADRNPELACIVWEGE